MNRLQFRRLSTLPDSIKKSPNFTGFNKAGNLGRGNWSPLPIPHRTIPDPKGQDLDFVNVSHSHLMHSHWDKLNALTTGLNPFRVKHILLKIKRDHVLSLEFFNWVELQKPDSHTLETYSMILHILTKANRFRSAESLLKNIVFPKILDTPSRLFEAIVYSYRLCDSSPRIFDSLFKTYAHVKKFRNATDTFCRMKNYGFLPTVESCNAYISSLIDLHRTDIALAFYREMRRCHISPNIYTLNMVICAQCKLGKLERAIEVFKEMESSVGCRPTVASFNTLIAGYCNQGLLSSAVNLKNRMTKNGCYPNVVTYNTLIHGFCKEGKLYEANKIFSEMKALELAPNTVTYNTLINGYGHIPNSEMARRLYEEMLSNGVKVDILTYNALILGHCKEGKTKKAANLVKELNEENLVPNSSTFSALICGQCKRQNSDRAYQLYKSMKMSGFCPKFDTFKMLISTLCKNEDFDGAVQVLKEMLESSLVPDLNLLDELCGGLCSCKKAELVSSLCKEMEVRHLLPEGFDKSKFIICRTDQ